MLFGGSTAHFEYPVNYDRVRERYIALLRNVRENGMPVPVNDQLLVGDCAGALHDFDISRPHTPPTQRWSIQLGGCVESTPAVWRGWIYVGSRSGAIFGISDPK